MILQHCHILRTAHFGRHPPSKAIPMSANCATWTSERIKLLKRCFHAGLSCGQIAREIGVTRNAVIGKMSRVGLSRPKDLIGRQLEQRRAARLARPKTPSTWRPKRPRLNSFAQHEVLMAFPRAQPPAEDIPIYNGRGCTLLELSQGKCRWPISSPGANDFCFCGNETVKGLPYCLGHARIAYRSVGRSARHQRGCVSIPPPLRRQAA
jgi:GcrA cell cycle regulator